MQDYTYDLGHQPAVILGSHMLEACPRSIAKHRPRIEIHSLRISDREDPVQLVFDVNPGRPSTWASPTRVTVSSW